LLTEQTKPSSQPAGSGSLDDNGEQNSNEGDRGDNLGPWDPHAEQDAGQRSRDYPGLAGPAHEQHLFQTPFGPAIRQGTAEDSDRSGNKHEDRHQRDTSPQIFAHQGKVDLTPQQNKDE